MQLYLSCNINIQCSKIRGMPSLFAVHWHWYCERMKCILSNETPVHNRSSAFVHRHPCQKVNVRYKNCLYNPRSPHCCFLLIPCLKWLYMICASKQRLLPVLQKHHSFVPDNYQKQKESLCSINCMIKWNQRTKCTQITLLSSKLQSACKKLDEHSTWNVTSWKKLLSGYKLLKAILKQFGEIVSLRMSAAAVLMVLKISYKAQITQGSPTCIWIDFETIKNSSRNLLMCHKD